jgi:hypothetical protein
MMVRRCIFCGVLVVWAGEFGLGALFTPSVDRVAVRDELL